MIQQASIPSGLRLVPIPRLAAGPRWQVEAMRSNAEPLLLWFTRGQGRITVAGLTRGYGAHNAVLIPAGTMYGFEAGAQVYGTALFFGRTPGLPLPAAPLHLRVRDAAAQTELTALLDHIQREQAAGQPGATRAADCYLGLVGIWLERQMATLSNEAAQIDAARRLVRRFTTLVEAQYATGMGVADYAAALSVTPTHLSRVCRHVSGRSASALVQDRVLFEARRMLSETDMKVAEIARGLGFASPAYFTRAFLRRTGKTPTEFRRNPGVGRAV